MIFPDDKAGQEQDNSRKRVLKIENRSESQTVNLAIDTILRKKQALVFVSSKSSAEKQANDICRECRKEFFSQDELEYFAGLSEKVLHALSSPTAQCKKLSECLRSGIAFHHSGLTSEQRMLIEDAFRENKLKIICCTPTLAAGLDLPAFRAILNSLKRFSNYGMSYIPVMEYKQMAGRAGRPGMEEYGEAIIIASNDRQKEEVIDKFINGEVEEILSKLAVEPVLRTYLLSLISTGIVKSRDESYSFFDKTFWAFQFRDKAHLHKIIDKMLKLLVELEFISPVDSSSSGSESSHRISHAPDETSSLSLFTDASDLAGKDDVRYVPTRLGQRVSELYLDPLTADFLIKSVSKIDIMKNDGKASEMTFLQMICSTLEIRPYLSLKSKDWNFIQDKIIDFRDSLIRKEPELYEDDYEEYFDQMLTAVMLHDWINEKTESDLMESYSVRPGEIRAKIEIADWIVYSSVELAKITGHNTMVSDLTKMRIRISDGVKEELLSLLKLKGIGRVRARKLFDSGIKTSEEVTKTDEKILEKILGKKTAQNVTGISPSQAKHHTLDNFI